RFRIRLTQFGAQLLALGHDIERGEHRLDRFRTDEGGESVFAERLLRLQELLLGQELALLQVGEARLHDDVALEVEDLLELAQGHVEHEADAARHRLHEPDVGHRRCELDVAHALATNLREGDLDAALLADDAAILHALVLAAQALVVLDRTEDARAEEAVPLRLERAVVDRLRLLDLAIRPRADALRARDRYADLVEALRAAHLPEQPHQLVHDFTPDARGAVGL